MVKRIFFLSSITIGILVSPPAAWAGFVAEIDCYGSLQAYKLDPNLRGMNCNCSNGPHRSPVCTSSSSTKSSRYNAGQDLKQQLMQSIVSGMIQNLLSVPDESQNEQLHQQQKARIAEEQEKVRIANEQAKKHWQKMLSEEELKRKLEQEEKVTQGNKLLLQMQTIGGGNKVESFRDGNPKLAIKSINQNTYSSNKLTDFQRLMCSAYFSNLAQNATNDVDVRFYADQSQRVMAGEPTYLECKIPQVSSSEKAKRMDEIKKSYEHIQLVVNKIQDIEEKLNETKEKITAAETKKGEVKVTITDLQNRAVNATHEEKNEIDILLIQAQNISQKIDQDIQQEKQKEINYQKEKEQAENEFNTMTAKLTK